MKLTREQVEAVLKPGDVILVHYLKKNLISAGIQFASGGTASHALCCLGGLEVVEADIGGVMHSFVDTYMRGNCRLTVKRLVPDLTIDEARAVTMFWRSRVSDSYDLGMIAHVAFTVPIRRIILPLCPPLGRLLLRLLGLVSTASTTLSTCAELWARGARQARPKFLKNYDPSDITPEALLRDATGLETVKVWEAVKFADDGRP